MDWIISGGKAKKLDCNLASLDVRILRKHTPLIINEPKKKMKLIDDICY